MVGERPRPRNAVLSWLPLITMSAVALVDIVAGSSVGTLPLVSLGPAFAGLVGGWRRTALVGVLALLLCVGLGMYDGLFAERRGFTAMASVAGVTGAGIAAAVMRGRREEELAGVRSIAEVAQRVLLRPVPLSVGAFRMAVSYTSAVAEAHIGGDLYEVVATPRGVRLIVGDVQGKGLAAVETAAVVLGAFREAAHDEPDLSGVGARLERSVAREADVERFVTAILAEVRSDGRVVFLNYGHPAPLVMRRDGALQFPQPPEFALPLGLTAHGGQEPRPFSVDFAPGDQLLLYTDGVTETRDGQGQFYPLPDRAVLLKEPDARQALEQLRDDLVRYAEGPLHDDAAMLLVRYREHTDGAGGRSTAPE